ncbi:hypothetical protein SAMN05421755_102023 [Nitrosomonas sp. Nm33]|nr:hypothetical protein SAMN05421755_102023 [Nitrosomonas sp. Nm33]
MAIRSLLVDIGGDLANDVKILPGQFLNVI